MIIIIIIIIIIVIIDVRHSVVCPDAVARSSPRLLHGYYSFMYHVYLLHGFCPLGFMIGKLIINPPRALAELPLRRPRSPLLSDLLPLLYHYYYCCCCYWHHGL